MGLDIRLPIGLLLTVIGVVLALFGWLGDPSIYQRSFGINVNLWWGLVLVAIGTAFLVLSRKHTAAMHSSADSKEGRATEAREHAMGVERE